MDLETSSVADAIDALLHDAPPLVTASADITLEEVVRRNALELRRQYVVGAVVGLRPDKLRAVLERYLVVEQLCRWLDSKQA